METGAPFTLSLPLALPSPGAAGWSRPLNKHSWCRQGMPAGFADSSSGGRRKMVFAFGVGERRELAILAPPAVNLKG
jgi:hypothetical protein